MLTKYAVRHIAEGASKHPWCECAIYDDAACIASGLSARYAGTFAVFTLGQGRHQPRLIAAFENGLQISTPAKREPVLV